MSFIGTAVAVASVGLGAASAAGAFTPSVNYPNTAASSAQMANVEASLLPEQLQMQAAAQEGGTTLNPGYTVAGNSDTVRAQLQQQIAQLQAQIANSAPRGGGHDQMTANGQGLNTQLQSLQQQLASFPPGSTVYKDANGKIVPESQAVSNFSGNSTADIQKQIMTQLAQGQLATAQQYDPQFIAQAAAQEAQANPQGVQARQQLYNDIQSQINNPPSSPVAQTMQNQIKEKVNAGSGLTPEEQAVLNSAVNQSQTGDTGGQPNLDSALTTGFAGEQRALQNAGSGATWLASGQTPADLNYRAQQQDLSNLSSYISGKTPESQFSELSGANAGPTPTTSTNYLPSYNGEAAATQGANAALSQYGEQVGQALNTANPWSAGLSTVLGGANTLAKAGVL